MKDQYTVVNTDSDYGRKWRLSWNGCLRSLHPESEHTIEILRRINEFPSLLSERNELKNDARIANEAVSALKSQLSERDSENAELKKEVERLKEAAKLGLKYTSELSNVYGDSSEVMGSVKQEMSNAVYRIESLLKK